MDVRFPKGSLGLRIERESGGISTNERASRIPGGVTVPNTSVANFQNIANPAELEQETSPIVVRSDAVQSLARPTKLPSDPPPIRDIKLAQDLLGSLLSKLADPLQNRDGTAVAALSAHDKLDPIMVAVLTGQSDDGLIQ